MVIKSVALGDQDICCNTHAHTRRFNLLNGNTKRIRACVCVCAYVLERERECVCSGVSEVVNVRLCVCVCVQCVVAE